MELSSVAQNSTQAVFLLVWQLRVKRRGTLAAAAAAAAVYRLMRRRANSKMDDSVRVEVMHCK